MTRYFQLRDDVTIRGRWHLSDVLLPTGAEPLFDAGEPVRDSGPLRGTVSHTGSVLDFTLTSFNVPIATSSLAHAVSNIASSDLQCLPVEIAGQAGMMVLNAVRVVRCIDETRSEFVKWTKHDHRADLAGQYRQVTKLVLATDAIPADAHFFRVEGWLVALIVSEAVKEAMERVGCLGAKFLELPT
ncbi:imm11 family protein [Sorangium sp. So ce426]|uniref:imm11 family protein n=1 Tax=Sorangium sp. So ce426 TaxID=3133312 RepID=UPI003F5BE9CA